MKAIVDAAHRAAARGTHPVYRHGAAIGVGNKVLATASNGYGQHAEFRVLQKVPRGVRGQDIILTVFRLTPGGKVKLSAPCKRCRALIERVGVRRVYYSIEQTS